VWLAENFPLKATGTVVGDAREHGAGAQTQKERPATAHTVAGLLWCSYGTQAS
jgi:hypothetical protein